MVTEGIYQKDELGRGSNLSLNILFLVLILILIVNRFLVFFTANMVIDSDQPFMWLGIKDYAEGHFYEPRFYGQDYNTFLESFVAVPFYKLGMQAYYALPLATHLLFLFPVLFTAITLFKKGFKASAILSLCVFDCLTLGFDIMTSLPRGFVTGVFFSSFFILSFVNPNSLKYTLLNGLMLAVGLFVNPNIILIGAPLFVFLFYHNYSRPAFYIIGGIVLAFFIPLYFVFDWFYDQHPDYIVYGLVHAFSPRYLLENLNHLDYSFAHVSFFVEENCIPLLLVLALSVVAAFLSGKKDLQWTIVTFIVVLFFALFTGKTREGSIWPYYSFSRMYLAVPFFLSQVPFLFRIRSATILICVAFLTLTFSAYKLFIFKDAIRYHTNDEHAAGVRIIPIKTIISGMEFFKNMALDQNCKHLVVSNIFWMGPYFVYGGPVFFPDFPSTEETQADHRYWVRDFNKDIVYNRFLIISINYEFDKITEGKFPFKIKKLDDWGVFLIYDNHMKNRDFLTLMRSIED